MVTNNSENSQTLVQNVEIPNKKYFMIGEVAKMCGVKTQVLRYWEGQFPQLNPSKRRGRRYYQRNDVLLILQINELLNLQRFTVEGAIAQLSSSNLPSDNAPATTASAASSSSSIEEPDLLALVASVKSVIKECQAFQARLKDHL